MSKREIDIEKDHLVIFRDREGAFSEFQWYGCRETSRESLEDKISKHNITEADDGRSGRVAKIEDGRLVREICAYRKRAESLEAVEEALGNAGENVDEAIEELESALDGLRAIRDV